MQRCTAPFIPGVYISAIVDKQLGHFSFLRSSNSVQGSIADEILRIYIGPFFNKSLGSLYLSYLSGKMQWSFTFSVFSVDIRSAIYKQLCHILTVDSFMKKGLLEAVFGIYVSSFGDEQVGYTYSVVTNSEA